MKLRGVVQARPNWSPALVRGVARVPRSHWRKSELRRSGIRVLLERSAKRTRAMGCKLFYSADLPVLTVKCHAPLVTLGRGCVFGQKPKAEPSVLTLGITYACGEGRVAGQHSSQVE